MTDAPERIWVDYRMAEDYGVAWSEPPLNGPRAEEAQYIHVDLHEAEVAALRATIHEVTDPDNIVGIMMDVHDMGVTLNAYAIAVSASIRAALRAKAKEAGNE